MALATRAMALATRAYHILHGSAWVLEDPYCPQLMTQTHPKADRFLEKS